MNPGKYVRLVLPLVFMTIWVSPIQAQMTKQQAEQHTTDKLLRALSEATKNPEGETSAQRQQRLQNLSDDMRLEDEAISNQQTEYYNSRTKRLLYGDGRSSGSPASAGEYSEQRGQRLNPSNNPVNPNAKPAGFGEGYAGGFPERVKRSDPDSATRNEVIVNRGRRQATQAGELEEVQNEAPARTCACRGADEPVYGIHCVKQGRWIEVPREKDWADGTVYEIGAYPWTEQCASY